MVPNMVPIECTVCVQQLHCPFFWIFLDLKHVVQRNFQNSVFRLYRPDCIFDPEETDSRASCRNLKVLTFSKFLKLKRKANFQETTPQMEMSLQDQLSHNSEHFPLPDSVIVTLFLFFLKYGQFGKGFLTCIYGVC